MYLLFLPTNCQVGAILVLFLSLSSLPHNPNVGYAVFLLLLLYALS